MHSGTLPCRPINSRGLTTSEFSLCENLLPAVSTRSRLLRSGWSVRQLDRQIASQFYERSKAARRNLVAKRYPDDDLTPDEHIRDPFVLEFLGLKDEYSEHELEEAPIGDWSASCLNSAMTSPLWRGRSGCGWETTGIGCARGNLQNQVLTRKCFDHRMDTFVRVRSFCAELVHLWSIDIGAPLHVRAPEMEVSTRDSRRMCSNSLWPARDATPQENFGFL